MIPKKQLIIIIVLFFAIIGTFYLLSQEVIKRQHSIFHKNCYPIRDHQFDIVTKDSIAIYTEDDKYLGTVKIDSVLQKLIQ